MKSSELKKYIEENIVEILNELDTDKTRGTAVVPLGTDPTQVKKYTDKGVDVEFKKGQIATEAKDEDEEVEDTYGKEDEDDKKDAKIKAAKPTKDELKKNASIATITDALAKAKKEFKEITEKYKKAEGKEKAEFLAKLKDLTPKIQTLKKALEKKEEALK
jgi:hypothetical protein